MRHIPDATAADEDALDAAAAPVLLFFALVKAVLLGDPIPAPKPLGGKKASTTSIDEGDIVLPDWATDRVEILIKYLVGGGASSSVASLRAASPSATASSLHFIETAATKAEFIDRLTTKVLYLPQQFNEYVMALDGEMNCSQCKSKPEKPVVCLKCRKIFCLKNKSKPELLAHTSECGRGCSVFLLIKGTMPLVMQTVNCRATQGRSYYVDRYGETDEGLRRGVALQLDKEAIVEFMNLWIQCGFDHDTVGLQHTWKDSIEEL